MKLLAILSAAVMALTTFSSRTEASPTSREGDEVPDFTFRADDGRTISFREQKGRWLILYFYPKDDTPGCTTEAKTFSSLLDEFRKANAVIFGINTDDLKSHLAFKAKHKLTVTLLTDPDGKAAEAFGIRVILGLCSRDSVLINPEGKIEKIYRGVKPEANPSEILAYITSKIRRQSP